MKFTKVVAQAFANKVYKSLKDAHDESVNKFELVGEEAQAIKSLVYKMHDLSKELEDVTKAIAEIHGGFYKHYNENPESAYKRLVRLIGIERIPSCPSVNELTDEFLIESVDAINTEELIAKVIAKYNG